MDKLDFGVIVVHDSGEVYNPLPNYLGNSLEIKTYSELVSSLQEKGLAGVCDTA